MSNWDDFKNDFKKATSKVIKKTQEVADSATVCVKTKAIEIKMAEEYEKLGKLVYSTLKESSPESLVVSPEITDLILKIDGYAKQIEDLKKQNEEKKAENQEEPQK